VGIAMTLPKSTEPLEMFKADGDFAFTPAFGFRDADDEALAIDILGTDVERFGET